MNPIDWIKRALGMVITPSIDHLTTYRAIVNSQSGQTLDVTCDDPRIGSLSGVPILLGIPGAVVTVSPGAHVRVGWRGGDPRAPYVSTWENGATLLTLSVDASTEIAINGGASVTVDGTLITLNGGTSPVARAVVDKAGPYPIVGGNTSILA